MSDVPESARTNYKTSDWSQISEKVSMKYFCFFGRKFIERFGLAFAEPLLPGFKSLNKSSFHWLTFFESPDATTDELAAKSVCDVVTSSPHRKRFVGYVLYVLYDWSLGVSKAPNPAAPWLYDIMTLWHGNCMRVLSQKRLRPEIRAWELLTLPGPEVLEVFRFVSRSRIRWRWWR